LSSVPGDPWEFPPDPASVREEAVGDIRRWRAEEGLAVDDDVVARLLDLFEAGEHDGGLWLLPEEEDAFWEAEEAAGEAFDAMHEVIGAYVDAHARDSFASLYQAGGCLHVGFVSDVDGHERELRKRVSQPECLQVFGARDSARERDTVRLRIRNDGDVLRAAGVHVMTSGTDADDPQRNGLAVGIVTADGAAAQALFAERYGDIVSVEVLGAELTEVVAVPWGLYAVAGDDRTLTVYYFTNATWTFERIEAVETAAEVRIAVLERHSVGIEIEPGANRSATVTLVSVLAERTVIDAASAKIKPRLAP
jgi:hypothetical protein